MSKEILSTINREKGYDYYVDKQGNLVKATYNWFRDRYTLAVIVLIIMSGLYYMEMSKSATNASNFDNYCSMYMEERAEFIKYNPDVIPTLSKVITWYEENKKQSNSQINISNIKIK